MKIINMQSRKKINPFEYVNINTGELLASEHPKATAVVANISDTVILSYDEYFLIDSKAYQYIQTIFSKADMEKIVRMADMVKGTFNILHGKKGIPHSPTTLRQDLNYDQSEFCRLMKRLYAKSIIYYLHGFKNNRKYKWIMLNPTLARKSKMFHKDCTSVFDNLSAKGTLVTLRIKRTEKVAC